MTAKSKMIIGICASVMLAAVVAITAVLMVSGRDSKQYQKHMELAQQYLDEMQYEQAIAEYELAIGIEPKNIEAYQALAELYVEMEDYESAVTVLNRGIEQTDGEELADYLAEVQETWEERKDLEYETQRYPIDSQEQVAAQAGGSKEETEYQKHMELAQQYLDEMQYEQAIAEYELAIGIEPKNMEAYQALAELYVKMDDYESAITVLNRSIEQTGGEELTDYLAEVQKEWEERKDLESETQEQQIDSQEQEAAQASGSKEETKYYDDGSYTVFEYDASGKLVKETFYNTDGTINYYNVYEYGASGMCVSETLYGPDGTAW